MSQPADRPLVTFFVMAYNQERMVRAAIEGAFAQTWEPLEVLLSDDCSPDGTFAVMQEMAAAYRGPHRVVLNRNPVNLGIVPHIDRIMEIARGAFVIQSGGDDVSEPDRAAVLAEAWLAGEERVKLVHSAVTDVDAEGRPLSPRRPAAIADRGTTPRDFIDRNMHVIGAAEGWDRALWDRFGPLAPTAELEDRALPFRALLIGEVAWIDRPLVRYRVGGVSDLSRPMNGREILFGIRLRYLRWFATSCRTHLRDMDTAPPFPDAEHCRRVCRRRMETCQFDVDLAEVGTAGRLALLPRALRLSLARRDPGFLRQALKYLFAPLYMRWLDWRYPPERLSWRTRLP